MTPALQDGERAELTRRLYELADMVDRGCKPADIKQAAEFIAKTVQHGWDFNHEEQRKAA